MAQLFGKDFGFFFRLGLIAAIAVIIVAAMLWRAGMDYPAAINAGVEQPVPFSHKHHVGDEGIDCRYCHASVEQSAFAGVPALSTCMTCHSQLFTGQQALAPLVAAFRSGGGLRWLRINQLPDFVYFDHSIHIAKGVGCVSCHGAVDQMPLTWRVAPLTMQWCLECHRNPERYLRPRDQIVNLHWKADDQQALGARLLAEYHIDKRRLTDCSVCHR
ncbi:MAG TPA: cytochrome c3 family protein [Steroidobacteraceae bacterium]